jgi:hypothetical protein
MTIPMNLTSLCLQDVTWHISDCTSQTVVSLTAAILSPAGPAVHICALISAHGFVRDSSTCRLTKNIVVRHLKADHFSSSNLFHKINLDITFPLLYAEDLLTMYTFCQISPVLHKWAIDWFQGPGSLLINWESLSWSSHSSTAFEVMTLKAIARYRFLSWGEKNWLH